jgi:hypothetical protein
VAPSLVLCLQKSPSPVVVDSPPPEEEEDVFALNSFFALICLIWDKSVPRDPAEYAFFEGAETTTSHLLLQFFA